MISPYWRSRFRSRGCGQLPVLGWPAFWSGGPGRWSPSGSNPAPAGGCAPGFPAAHKTGPAAGKRWERGETGGGAVLLQRKEGEILWAAVNRDHHGGKAIFLYILQQSLQPVQQPPPALLSHGVQPRVGASARPAGQLPADQGGQAAEGIQQPLVRLGLGRRGGEQALQLTAVRAVGSSLAWAGGGGKTARAAPGAGRTCPHPPGAGSR